MGKTKAGRTGLAGVAAIATAILLYGVMPNFHASGAPSGHWETPGPVLLLGVIVGMTYGLLGAGLVLVYRSSKIINFSHGQTGAFAAALFGIVVVKWHIPYWLAFIPVLGISFLVGAAAEAAVIRRLRKAPPVMSVVATLGIGQFLVLFAFAINTQAGRGDQYPQPAGFPSFNVGVLPVTPAYSGMLILSPIVIVAMSYFLKTSRIGLAIRAAAANPETARMSAVFATRMSSLVWGLAAVLSGFSAILTQPTQGFATPGTFGPGLLLIALTAAVVARMRSVLVAMIVGVGIGVLQNLLLWNYSSAGLVQLVLFAIMLTSLLLQKAPIGRAEEKGSWAAVQAGRPLPAAIRAVPAVRAMKPLSLIALGIVLLLIPTVISNAASGRFTEAFAYVVVGLSVGVITGLGGQLSLGQFALAAVGAFVSYQVSTRSGNFLEAFLDAGMVAAAVGVLLGLPALRIKGLLLTVTTLAFALVMPSYLLGKPWLLGTNGINPGQPILFGKTLTSGRQYYYVGLTVLVIAFILAANVRRGGLGRKLIAVRDNEDAARAFTVSATWIKVQGFAVSGFLAGLGGALYGHSRTLLTASSFPTGVSIDIVVMAVIGGLGLLSGPALGALIVVGLPQLSLDNAGLAASSLGQLLLIMYLPRGLGSVALQLRDRIAATLARWAGVDVEAAYAAERGFNENRAGAGPAPVLASTSHRRSRHGVLLRATGVTKSFGGIRAVRGVSLEVREGETLGLIGPNGAGKTTTFELLAGFTRSDAGRVEFAGQDVTRLGPEARGKLGLIRSFQDAALFPTLTVLECIELALERVEPTRFLYSVLGLTIGQRGRRKKAEELLAWMGLERYRSSEIQELSTGTRRITELACLVALQPRMLLLDEPSSGVAQKETEALGALLVRLKRELNLTLVIIEHDIPLIMSLSDRIICMAEGEIISSGTPEEVRHDPLVVEAYLGGSITAIERSHAGKAPVQRSTPRDDGREVALAAVPGLGPQRAAALLAEFGTPERIRSAGPDALRRVPGIGLELADRIHSTLRGGQA